jgi:hypothetical protein
MREAKKEICKERVETEAERERGKMFTSVRERLNVRRLDNSPSRTKLS